MCTDRVMKGKKHERKELRTGLVLHSDVSSESLHERWQETPASHGVF
jgi:hypothetical protein